MKLKMIINIFRIFDPTTSKQEIESKKLIGTPIFITIVIDFGVESCHFAF